MNAPIAPGSPDWLRAMAACEFRCIYYDDAIELEAAADRIEQLERENGVLRAKVEQLERAILRYAHTEENLASTVRGLEFELEKAQTENAALRASEESLASTVRGLEFELEKADAALDWLNTHCLSADPIMGRSTYRWTIEHDEPDIRAAISKAMA